MKTTTLTEDILVYCVAAHSFPEGVQQAHNALGNLVPASDRRNYFGLSWPDGKGGITYKAGVTALEKGELDRLQLETKLIEKGNYLYIDIPEFMKNIPAIGAAFQQLIQGENIAPDGFCIEWYLSAHLCRCMVKMQS